MAARADVALLNSGTLRSDRVHPKGQLCMGVRHAGRANHAPTICNRFLQDLFAILPMIDGTVVIEATGAQILAALENGVSKWPALEGRFPQVAGSDDRYGVTVLRQYICGCCVHTHQLLLLVIFVALLLLDTLRTTGVWHPLCL